MEAPSKLFDQFFGRNMMDDDLLKDMKGMYIRKPSMPSLTGLSEVRKLHVWRHAKRSLMAPALLLV